MVGDFNCPGQPNTIDPRLSTILADRGCIQYVSESTREPNLLDLIISFPSTSTLISSPQNILGPPLIHSVQVQSVPFSDHKLISFNAVFPRPIIATSTFTFRNLRSITSTPFLSLLQNSQIFTNPPRGADDYAAQLDSDVLAALDAVAPVVIRTKRSSQRSSPAWMTKEAINAKRVTRQLERRFKKSGSAADFAAWKRAGRLSVKEIKTATDGHLSSMVKNVSSEPAQRWKAVQNILHESRVTNSVANCNFSAQVFSDYFVDKIALIRTVILSNINSIGQVLVPPTSSSFPSTSFLSSSCC